MARATKAEIEATFRRLMDITGGDYNHDDVYSGWNVFMGDYAEAAVGRYYLDFAPPYGGWCIERISNKHGGTNSVTMHGLSAGRMTGARFLETMRFTIDLIESLKDQGAV